MPDFSSYIDLPLVWAGLMAIIIFLYVLLDGFDLGVGILFPFAPSDKCRDRMMNSIVPFWDCNETWLVMGGGALFVGFPLAYAILLPAFYIPIILMLLGLISRGVAFEFRSRAHHNNNGLWDIMFHIGSLVATISQGMILGGFIHGVSIMERNFVGGPFDWLNGFSIMTGVALVFGYALLGSTWLIMKTTDVTQKWARNAAQYVIGFVMIFIALIAAAILFTDHYQHLWLSGKIAIGLALIAIIIMVLFFIIISDLFCAVRKVHEARPFIVSICIFTVSYIGLISIIFPWIVPFKFTIWDAAGSQYSLSLMLIIVTPMLPLILCYTGYCYYVFRGKSHHDQHMY